MDVPLAVPPPPVPIRVPSFGLEPGRTHRGKWLWMGILLLLLASAIVGCGLFARSIQRSKGEARALIDGLHGQMTGAQWDAIYAEASPEYRNGTSREQSQAYFSAVVRKLGPPRTTSVESWQLNEDTGGTFLSADFKTTFAKDASGMETLQWKRYDGRYRLVSYTVNSADLVER